MKKYLNLFTITLLLFLSITTPIVTYSASPSANNWTNEEAQEKFEQTVLKICDTLKPNYLALALEVNTFYQYHEEDFDRFVDLYKAIYDTIKSNPTYANTKVYVTFQLERMKGLGKAVGYSGKPQWEILSKFEGKLDLLVFTTYPEVEYPTPAKMPDDYYSSIYNNIPANLRNKNIAISEMGWNSANLIPVTGKNNSPKTQAQYIEKFAKLINDLKDAGKVEYVAWTFMHDFKDYGVYNPLRTIGLFDSRGKAKDAGNNVLKMWYSFNKFESPAFKIGIGPVPRNFPGSTEADWFDMFQKVPYLATLMLAQTHWYDSPAKAGEVPQLFIDFNAAKKYHKADCLYGINFFNTDNGEPKIAIK